MSLGRLRLLLIVCIAVASSAAFASFASADTLGQQNTFFVNSRYDRTGRNTISATLRQVGNHAYFYVDDEYWNSLTSTRQESLSSGIANLSADFDSNIYTKETTILGSEPNPGVDNDPRTTLLLEYLAPGSGGYFETGNLYPRSQAHESNEREMIAVNIDVLGTPLARDFLAHEFQHLISFHQKEQLRNASEEIWLNETRSEYAITLVGYNSPYDNSNLEHRVNSFLRSPSDSLTEWPNTAVDYGNVAVFAEYLAGRFGDGILTETLRDPLTGINSLEAYWQRKGIPETFVTVFRDWMLANYLNDTSKDPRFGYADPDLKTIRVSSQYQAVIVDVSGATALTLVKNWQPVWHEFQVAMGTNTPKALRFDITADRTQNFIAPYIVFYDDGSYDVLEAKLVDGAAKFYIVNPAPSGRGPKSVRKVVIAATNARAPAGTVEEIYNLSVKGAFATEQETEEALLSSPAGLQPGAPILQDGALIKRNNLEKEMYVVSGKYKRYLRPEIIALYGQLDPAKVIPLEASIFDSYTTANYVRNVNQEKVYAVWPDGTKHWLNITPAQWDASGRDWGAIFIINDAELNRYVTGVDITR